MAQSDPKVVNISTGWCHEYVGRPSKWGNPFVIPRDGTREEVIRKYETYLTKTRPDLMDALPELRGKRLGCHCAPKACHADVLLRLANE